MAIWCQADTNASLSGANSVPIHLDLMSIQVVNPAPIRCTSSVHSFESNVNLVSIQCESDANPVPIWCQSNSIHSNLIPNLYQSDVNLMPIQCQFLPIDHPSANPMPIPDQSANPMSIHDQSVISMSNLYKSYN